MKVKWVQQRHNFLQDVSKQIRYYQSGSTFSAEKPFQKKSGILQAWELAADSGFPLEKKMSAPPQKMKRSAQIRM